MPLQPNNTPSIGGLFKSTFNKSKLSSLKKSYLMTSLSSSLGNSPAIPVAVTKMKPSTEALSQGLTSFRTSLSKKVGELRNEYNTATTPLKSTTPSGSSYGKTLYFCATFPWFYLPAVGAIWKFHFSSTLR